MVPDELTTGPRFAAFAERYIRHTIGRWASEPLVLEQWQREFWWEALEVDPTTGRRIYTEVGLGIPRKNGKSTMGAAAALYFLVAAGEHEPQVYVAAGARAQARIIFDQARSFAQSTAGLRDRLSVGQQRIRCPRNGGFMRPLSSDAGLQHGLNPSANFIDELHAHRNGDLYTALTTGTGAREQPFTIWITTAGVAGQGILDSLYQSMFDGPGELEDRGSLRIYRDRGNGVLIYWYGAPRDADIEDPAVWHATNPSSWIRAGDFLPKQFAKLKQRGALLEWRMYHLNQFAEYEEAWLPTGAWAACRDERTPADAPLHDLRADLPIGVAVDRSQTSDLAAIAVAQRQGELCVVRSRTFAPDHETGRIDSEGMRAYLAELRTRFPLAMAVDPDTKRPVPGPAVAYDPISFSESADMLEDTGLNMIRFAQTDSLLAPATTIAYELITSGRLRHDGDPVLAEHVGASQAKLTERGMRITKLRRGSPRKNVAAVAMVMAIAMAMPDPPPAPRKQLYASFS